MIDTSRYEEGEGNDFVFPAPPPAQDPPVVFAWREPTLFRRVNEPSLPSGKPGRKKLLTTGAVVLAMVSCAFGIPLCLSIVLFPLGFAIMMAGCYPLHKLNEAHSKRLDAWYDRDRPLDEDTVKPWEM